MLSGNPTTFAIWFDAVDAWSTDRFQNGCLGYFIDGGLIWSPRSTLGVDMYLLSKLPCMTRSLENDTLFSAPASLAYEELCKRAFPELDADVDENDFTHLVSADSLSDDGVFVFLVESGSQARLMYGTKERPEPIEVALPRGEFQAVVKEALVKWAEIERTRNDGLKKPGSS